MVVWCGGKNLGYAASAPNPNFGFLCVPVVAPGRPILFLQLAIYSLSF